MKREEWESLVSSPGWAALRRYLMDARARLSDDVMDGRIGEKDRAEAIYRAQNLKDLAEMDWATIAKFYGIEEEPKETT